ncbi:MAG: hypothetical protein AB1894_14855 [Chloroflexota bacterium]
MDKDKMLRLMRFWMFGTFLIIFVAATLFAGAVIGTGLLILREPFYWLAMGIAAAACVATFFGYKWYLDRKA